MLRYIKNHWRGEHPLALAYWVNGALLSVLFTIAMTYIDHETELFYSLSFAISFIVASFAATIWSVVGIWRSANGSIARARAKIPKGTAFWAYAAKVMVVLGILRGAAEWLPVVHDLRSLMEVAESDIATQYYIEYGGETDVILNGYINDQSVTALLEAFQDRRRTALILNSPGGILLPAYKLADFVEANGIIVAVREKCVSSCLLVLAASHQALAAPDAYLVFHHPEATAEFMSAAMADELSQEIGEYYDRFERYGVPREELEAMRQAGTKSLSLGEAYNDYIVDMVWKPNTNEFLEVEAYCKNADCFSTPESNE